MSLEARKVASLLKQGRNAIFLHSNADLDCAGAASALALHFKNSTLHAPEGLSHLAKKLLSGLDLEIRDDVESAGGLNQVVVDASSDSSLGYGGIDWDRAIVIDHHTLADPCRASRCIIDSDAASSCEIVWEIMGRPENISREIGQALMAGLLADTGGLRRGSAGTLRNASEILAASGLRLEDIQQALESAEDQDVSRRVSSIKGAQRLRFDRAGDWIVASTETGSFESAACHALLSIGADVAFAASQKEGQYRIAARANQAALRAGIQLGTMLDSVAGECGGEGGGHDGAAGLSGTGEAEALLNICMANALRQLKGKQRGKQSLL